MPSRHNLKNLFAANKCLILLLLFLAWFASAPLEMANRYIIVGYVIAYLGLMICGVYVITGSRILLGFSSALALCASYEWIIHLNHPNPQMMELFGVTVVLFDFSMASVLLLDTIMARQFKRDMLFGVIFTFFMLGQSFGDAFYVMQYWGWVKFNVAGPSGIASIYDCIYFSFTTLTTTGYGDIVPLTRFAKRMTSVEECVGVLYVAVFIGRLMSAYGNDYQNKQAKQ